MMPASLAPFSYLYHLGQNRKEHNSENRRLREVCSYHCQDVRITAAGIVEAGSVNQCHFPAIEFEGFRCLHLTGATLETFSDCKVRSAGFIDD